MKLRFNYSIWKHDHILNIPINFHDYQLLNGKIIDFGNKPCIKVDNVIVDRVWCEPVTK